MAEERINLETEVQAVLDIIDEERHFLLSGGAGSGKTYSLVQVIKQVLAERPQVRVACMTYTNAAVREIDHRVNHKHLTVSTIHDFLWDNIKHYQKELKICLVELANNPDVKEIKIEGTDPVPENYFESFSIDYKEFVRVREGIISHDELLVLASKLFEKYPKVNGILKDKYPFIFVDEYQDTSKYVVEIFLQHFKSSDKKNIIGFFGDSMQSIYDGTISNLNLYKGDQPDQVAEVKKNQNRRNPQGVIDLANRIRTDGIEQEPSDDENAPNMKDGEVKPGNIKFIYSENPDFDHVRVYLRNELGWPIDDSVKTKELNLTHNLIADKAKFRNLMDIYDRDQNLEFRDRIRKYIKENGITEDFSGFTFGEVIKFLQTGKEGNELRKVKPTPTMQEFIDSHQELYNIALTYNYVEFSKIYVSSDQLIDDKKQSEDEENKKGSKRDHLIKHLFKIQLNIDFYTKKKYNEFLRATDYRTQIRSIQDKKNLKESIDSLIDVGDKTIEEVILQAHEAGICLIDEKLELFKIEKKYVYDQVKNISFQEFQKLYAYLEGHTPFSTQHKTKGTEFHTVLVILDNGNWNKYNFTNLFLENGNPSVLERTQKIFYVCCTRAMENLAVFFHNPSSEVIAKAKIWFGENNIIKL